MTVRTEAKPAVGEERFLVTGISWDLYRAFCDEIEDNTVRLSYDRGRLELMTTKSPHEYYKKMIAKLIEAVLLEFDIPVRSGGSMTFQRSDLLRGFEPDECWWIEHERAVRGKGEIDFHRDPPPDLVIEVEITHSLVDRIGICAALGIPELWRCDGQTLEFLILDTDSRQYRPSENSRSFPFLKPEDLEPFLTLDEQADETSRVRGFVDWLRKSDLQHR